MTVLENDVLQKAGELQFERSGFVHGWTMFRCCREPMTSCSVLFCSMSVVWN